MKVFKLFYRLLYARRTQVIFGVILLAALITPVTTMYHSRLNQEFTVTKTRIALFNKDDANIVTEAFVDYLDEVAEIVPIENEPEKIADALYYDKVSYVLSIPKGFGDSLRNNQAPLSLEKNVTSSAAAEANVDNLITRYLASFNIMKLLITDPKSEAQLQDTLTAVKDNLTEAVEIVPSKVNSDIRLLVYGESFTHYISYVMLMTFITCFGYAIISMRNPEIVKRDRMSNMTESNRMLQTLLGCLSFALIYWVSMIGIATLFLSYEVVWSEAGRLITLSSFISMFGVQALAYLICILAPSEGVISFLSTITSLLIAFSSGIFLPRQFVGDGMQKVAALATPIWQNRADELILQAKVFDEATMAPILSYFGIMIVISFAYYAISFAIQKYRLSNSVYMS